jgi:hypothetical protein
MKENNTKSSKTKGRPSNLVDKFDKGEDISEHFDFNAGTKTVNVDLPVWAIKALDGEANRRGVARQALIKMWLIDRLDSLKAQKAS